MVYNRQKKIKGGFIMGMPNGYTFVGKLSCPNSKRYATYINEYCAIYKYNGSPLDARLVASVISAEVGNGWNTNSGSGDYARTHSAGLGQFTDATGPSYGLYTQADKENPQKCIKAICWYYSNCLTSAHGDAYLAYEQYNGGPNGGHVQEAINNMNQNFVPAYKNWMNYTGIKKITNSPTPAIKNNNTNALNDAKKAQAQKAANAKIEAQKKNNEIAKANALHSAEVLKKAKLTKNPIIIKQAQDAHNANKAKIIKKPIPKIKVVKSGMGIFGLLAIIIVLKNGYDL
jgi:hypothetical protein